jgi:hypothetical protein
MEKLTNLLARNVQFGVIRDNNHVVITEVIY